MTIRACGYISVILIFFLSAYSVYAGQLKFEGVPVDITTADNEDLVIAPGSGGKTRIGIASVNDNYAVSQNDLFVSGILETGGAGYFDTTLTVTGPLTANGNVILGDGSSDKISVTGRLASDLLPNVDSSYNIGSSIFAFSGVYAGRISSSGSALILSPASGYPLTGNVFSNAASGDETAYDLALTVDKSGSGNYCGVKLDVTETLAPGSANKLLDLQVSGNSRMRVYSGMSSADYGLLSLGTGYWDGSSPGHFAGSADGTMLAVNAPAGFAGNFIDLQAGGASRFYVDYLGNIVSSGSQIYSGDMVVGGDLAVNGGNLTTTAPVFNLLNSGASTVNFAQGATNLSMGSSSGTTLVNNSLTAEKGFTLSSGALNLSASSGALSLSGLSPSYISTGENPFVITSGGESSWSVTNGNLALSTLTSGNLVLTSAGSLNLAAGAPSVWTFPASTSALNIASGLLNIDTINSRIGVGTASPAQAFDVAGTGRFSAGLITPKLYPAADSATAVQINKADGTANVVNIDTINGRVGIGTTAPAAPLDIIGAYTDEFGQISFRHSAVETTAGWIGAGTQSLVIGVKNSISSDGIRFETGTSTGAEAMRITSAGNVGIGTTSPAYTLDVSGDIRATGTIYGASGTQVPVGIGTENYLSKWSASGTLGDSVVYDDGTKVGIGTTEPEASLHTNGAMLVTGSSVPTSAAGVRMQYSGGQGDIVAYDWGSSSYKPLALRGAPVTITGNVGIGTTSPGSRLVVQGTTTDSTASGLNVIDNSGASILFVRNDGKVGIGTETPSLSLTIDKSSNPAIAVSVSGSIRGTLAAATASEAYSNFATAGDVIIRSSNEDLILTAKNSSGAIRFGAGNPDTEKVTILNSGNVGIGTTSPAYTLDVSGDIRATGTIYGASGTQVPVGIGTENYLSKWSASGTLGDSVVYDDGTKVGIGTTAPSFPLSFGTALGNKIALYDSGSGNGYGFGIQASLLQVFSTASDTDITFGYGNSSSMTRNVTFKGNGTVGIGTTVPGTKLHVYDDNTAVLKIEGGTTSTPARRAILDLKGNQARATGILFENAYNPWFFGTPYLGGDTLQIGKHATQPEYPANAFVTISSTGNVGIGTTSPAYKLDVRAVTEPVVAALSTTANDPSSGRIIFGVATGAAMNEGGVLRYDGSANQILLGSNISDGIIKYHRDASTDTLMISSTGNVGIGTTSPAYTLDVSGDIRATGTIYGASGTQVPVGTGTENYLSKWSASGTLGDSVVYDDGTNVGIGTASPSTLLEIAQGDIVDMSKGLSITKTGQNWRLHIDTNNALNIRDVTGTTNKITIGNTVNGNVLFNTGNVGIGTTSPAAKLDVYGAIKLGGGTYGGITYSDTPIANNTQFFSGYGRALLFNAGDVNDPDITILSSGNVGIGTTSPTKRLEVVDNSSNGTVNLVNTLASGYASFDFWNNSGVKVGTFAFSNPSASVYPNSLWFGTRTNNPMYLFTNDYSNIRMAITENGNVGIGTTAPGEKLHIYGATGVVRSKIQAGAADGYATFQAATDAGDLRLGAGGSTATSIGAAGLGYLGTFVNKGLQLVTNGNERMRIDNLGNVGIGTTSPAYTLDVSGDIRATGTIYGASGTQVPVGTGTENYLSKWSASGTLGDSVVYDDGTNVGIGTTAPGAALHVAIASAVDWIRLERTGTRTWGFNSSNGHLNFYDETASTLPFVVEGGAPSYSLYVKNSGNIGIGTAEPSGKLHVSYPGFNPLILERNDDSAFAQGLEFRKGRKGVGVQAGDQLFRMMAFGELNDGTYASASNHQDFMTAEATDSFTSVAQGRQSSFYVVPTGSITQTLALRLLNNGNVYMPGNVGIGTTTPGDRLELATGVNPGLLITGSNTTAAESGSISFASNADNTDTRIRLVNDEAGNILRFDVRNTKASAWTPAMSIIRYTVGLGNVGIGTTSPAYNLDVSGDIRATGTIYGASGTQVPVGTGTENYLSKWSASGTLGDSVVYDDGTKVGIGTTTPEEKLHIGTGSILIDNSQFFKQKDSSGTARQVFVADSSNNLYLGSSSGWTGGLVLQYPNTAVLKILSGASEKVRIDSSGNVGIGTTAPGAKLNIVSTGAIHSGSPSLLIEDTTYRPTLTLNAQTDKAQEIVFKNQGTTKWWFSNRDEAAEGSQLRFYSGDGIARLAISQNGNVGIGTTSPATPLTINASSADPQFRITRSASPTQGMTITAGAGTTIFASVEGTDSVYGRYQFDSTKGASTATRMYIDSNGNVGIGTTAPDRRLTVKQSESNVPAILVTRFDENDISYKVGIGEHWDATNGEAMYLYSAAGVAGGLDSSNVKMAIFSNGNVGIGTTSPAYNLDVSGDIRATGTIYGASGTQVPVGTGTENYLSKWSASGTLGDSVVYDDGTNVGIGTTTPQGTLDVNGIIYIGGADSNIRYRSAGGTSFAFHDGTSAESVVARDIRLSRSFSTTDDNDPGEGGIYADGILKIAGAGNSYILGNVGIGTTTPTQKLDLSANIANGGFLGTQTLDTGRSEGLLVGVYKETTAGAYTFSGLWPYGVTPSNTNYIFGTTGATSDTYFGAPTGKSMYFQVAADSKMIITSAGNVGIGTTTPGQALDVIGNVRIYNSSTTGKGFLGYNGSDTAHRFSMVRSDSPETGTLSISAMGGIGLTGNKSAGYEGSNYQMYLSSAGNVGIGTTSPGTKLDVYGSLPKIRISDSRDQDWSTNNVLGSLEFYTADTVTSDPRVAASISQITDYSGSHNTPRGALQFNVSTTGAASEAMRISSAGNVGIGTTSPAYNLDVSGDIRATGTIYGASGTQVPVGTGTENYLSKWSASGTLGDSVVYDDGTNVGIGTTAPGAKLEVAHGVANFKVEDLGTYSTKLTSSGGLGLNANGGGSLVFLIADTEKARIDTAGNVGIGTTTPEYELDVNGVIRAQTAIIAGMNVETLSANKTLTPGSDKMYQYLDPNGVSRNITLATATAVTGDRFILRNNAASYNSSYYLAIYQSTTLLDYVYVGSIKEYVFDGVNWISGSNGSGGYDNKRYNIALGYNAIAYDSGTALGYDARGYTSGAAVGNNSYGYNYGAALGSGSKGMRYGVAIGYQAGKTQTTLFDLYNVLVGAYAGYQLTGNSGVGLGNIMVGYQSGYDATYSPTTGSKNILIGFQAGAPSNTTSNFLNIGNAIFATGINNSTFPAISEANVGIGITTPNAPLHVTAAKTNNILARFEDTSALSTGELTGIRIQGKNSIGDSQYLDWFFEPNTGKYGFGYGTGSTHLPISAGLSYADLTVDNQGNVGIGTTSPAYTLDVSGDIRATGTIYGASGTQVPVGTGTENYLSKWSASGTLGDSVVYDDGTNVGIGTTDITRGKIEIKQGVNTINGGIGITNSGVAGSLRLWVDASNIARISSGGTEASNLVLNGEGIGNVGIGTTSPSEKLDVSGATNTYVRSVTTGASGSAVFKAQNDGTASINMRADGSGLSANSLFGLSRANLLELFSQNGGLVVGTLDANDLTLGTNNTANVTIKSAGNVGIGTTSPSELLQVGGTAMGSANRHAISLGADGWGVPGVSGVNSNGDKLILFRNETTSMGLGVESSNMWFQATQSGSAGGFKWYQNGIATMILNTSGNVGIGTTTPATKLDILGDLTLSTAKTGTASRQIGMRNGNNISLMQFDFPEATSIQSDIRFFRETNNSVAPQLIIFKADGTNSPQTSFSARGTSYINAISGNVGIGTTSPAYTLDVSGDIRATGTIYGASGTQVPVGTGTENYLSKWSASGTLGDSVVYDDGTNVGIGTTAPATKLDIDGTLGVSANSSYTTSSGAGFVFRNSTSPDYEMYGGYDMSIDGAFLQGVRVASLIKPFYINPRGADVSLGAIGTGMIVKSSGSVGIGTTSPSSKLHVGGTTGNSYISLQGGTTSSDYGIDWLFSSASTRYGSINLDWDTRATKGLRIASGYPISFYTAVTDGGDSDADVIIDSSGNVGIGTATPGDKLEVYKDQASTTRITVNNPSVADGAFKLISFKEGSNEQSYIGVASSGDVIEPHRMFIWNTENARLQFGTNGTEKMTILGSGNVGIGTTSPAYTLDVSGDIRATGTIYGASGTQVPVGTGTENYLSKWSASGTLGDSVVYDDGTNVGIGTTSPNALLDILNTTISHLRLSYDSSHYSTIGVDSNGYTYFGGTSGRFYFNASNKNNVFYVYDYTDGASSYATYNGSSYTLRKQGNTTVSIPNNGNAYFNQGNVGIGTTTPARKLHIYSTELVSAIFERDVAADVGIQFKNPAFNWTFGFDDSQETFSIAEASDLNSGSQHFVIKSGGNVGIGTTTPGTQLEVMSASGGIVRLKRDDIIVSGGELLGELQFYSNDNNLDAEGVRAKISAFNKESDSDGIKTNLAFYTVNGVADNLAEAMRIDESGNVGIGTTTPAYKLDVSGDIRATGTIYGASGTQVPVGTGTENYLSKWSASGTLGDSVLYDDGTNVGIGTTSPSYKLDVNTTSALHLGNLYVRGTGYNPVLDSGASAGSLTFGSGVNNPGGRIVSYGGMHATLPGIITFSTGIGETVPEVMRIDSTGNVGIGTAAPNAVLEVSKANSGAEQVAGIFTNAAIADATAVSFKMQNSTDTSTNYGAVKFKSSRNVGGSADLLIQASDNTGVLQDRFIIDKSGNVGIGTTAPGAKLEITPGSTVGDEAINVKDEFIIKKVSTSGYRIMGRGFNTISAADSSGFGLLTSSNTAQFLNAKGIFLGASYASSAANEGEIRTAAETNLIFSPAGSTAMTILSGGNVGIGTTAPGEKLEVAGAIKSLTSTQYTGFYLHNGSHMVADLKGFDDDNDNGNLQLYDNGVVGIKIQGAGESYFNGGNIGIGTTAPGATLDVVARAITGQESVMKWSVADAADAYIDIRNNTSTDGQAMLAFRGVNANNVGPALSFIGDVTSSRDSGTSGAITFQARKGSGVVANRPAIVFDNYTERLMTILSSGNVGIGTTAPGEKLEVSGAVPMIKIIDPSYPDRNIKVGVVNSGGYGFGGLWFNQENPDVTNYALQAANLSGAVSFNSPAGQYMDFRIGNAGKVRIDTSGNVGIGTTAPVNKLNVAGANASSSVGDLSLIGITNTDTTNNNTIGFGFNQANASGAIQTVAGIDLVGVSHTDGAQSGALAFATRNAGSWGERLRIDPSGNVGVGTDSPSYVLDVQHASSKVNSKNGYLTNGADYAEYFENEEIIPQGALVGMNMVTGKVHKYTAGDEFIGIVSSGGGFVGNGNKDIEKDSSYTLVGLLGQLDFVKEETIIENRIVYTKDRKRIGILLSSGKVLLR